MKKLLFSIFMLTALSSVAQSTYYPLVHEGDDQQWNVLNVTEPYHYTWGTEIQFIEGDSIIDGIAYKQAWRKNSDGTGLRIKGFVREESKRVYSRLLSYYNGDYVLGEEVLLYDFNLTEGDTVTTVGEAALTLIVIEESEVEVNGTMRRQLGLGGEPWPFGSVYEYWIEGVGSTYGFLNSGSETICGSSSHLLCYHENDDLIWDNEEYDSCVLNCDGNTFQVDGLIYYVKSFEQQRVSLVGHVDGQGAQGELIIPETVSNLNSFTVTTIGSGAFKLCSNLTGQLVIPNTVTTIEEEAFIGCGFTGELVLSNSLVSIGPKAFQDCEGLTGNLTIPNTVTEIKHDAFYSCNGFTYLVIGETVEQIESQAFFGCEPDTIVILAAEPPTLGEEVFVPKENQHARQLLVPCGAKDAYLALEWTNYFPEEIIVEDCDPVIFAPQGAEWYFDVFNPWGTHPEYERFFVEGDTIIQGHRCSIINQHFVDTGHEGGEFVYGEDNKVYWFNPTTNAFTTLYDFDAEAGESWYYEVGECSHQVTVDSVGSVTWNGHTYRTQWVRFNEDLQYYSGKIIEGIGYEKGLFPSIYVCDGLEVFDAREIEYLRCYVKDSEMLYHEGDYECDQVGINTFCWDGTVAEAYAGGDGTEENPYQIANAKQLALLAQQTNDGTGGNAYYKLTANINLEKCTGGYNPWTSIGVLENDITPRYFTGHFDGGGNIILNLYQCHDATFKGLFGCTDGAEIKDVNLVYCQIGNASEYAGGLVAYAGLTDISNCSVQNSNVITTGGVAGGIVGYAGMPFRIHETNENVSKITNCEIELVTVESAVNAGGIVGKVNDDTNYARYLVSDCSANNEQYYHVKGSVTGGIVGEMRYGTVKGCASKTIVVGTGQVSNVCVGGIAGSIHGSSVIANSYNRGNVVADFEFAGGIVGFSAGNIYNVYNAGEIYMPNPNSSGYGTIVGNVQSGERLNCYWLENDLPAAGNPIMPDMPGSTSFHQGNMPTDWVLHEPQYATSVLLEALNFGPHDDYLWLEDTEMTNGGLPIPIYIKPNLPIQGSEWYYEILNDDGSITYQYLQHSGDTTINDEPVQIIVKINTLYDKGEHIEKSYEYIYERDGKVYWWNKTLEEFTLLYDYNAQVGDEWEIKVGTQSLVMHVDAAELYDFEGRQYEILQVSDEENLFSGMIVCGIGHLTSFFPEKLLNKGYRVEGIRCFWQNGELIFKYGNRDCDEVYEEFHDYGMDEPAVAGGFKVYPNPTDGIITLLSAKGFEYCITNMMGQILMTGQVDGENQRIDVSKLPQGLYFITVGANTQKFVVR